MEPEIKDSYNNNESWNELILTPNLILVSQTDIRTFIPDSKISKALSSQTIYRFQDSLVLTVELSVVMEKPMRKKPLGLTGVFLIFPPWKKPQFKTI